MKLENYLYICDETSEPTGTNRAVLIPASKILGMRPGVVAGTDALKKMVVHFESMENTGASGEVVITMYAADFIATSDAIVAAINSNVTDGFVVLADNLNNEFCSDLINTCNVLDSK
tara:strand:+ start:178 stop:528 length:351 start_codon:yes stop_codon:yes gene_type:complete